MPSLPLKMGSWVCKMCYARVSSRRGPRPSAVANVPNGREGGEATAPSRCNVLLLGASGSGKTELGHCLSETPRAANDHGPTNGVRHFRVTTPTVRQAGSEMALTEVGGSLDLQRIWPHYYEKALAIIYCFDLSAGYASLSGAFNLLRRVLAHPAVLHKCVLLVATHAQSAVCEGLQLYDIENSFGLEALARHYGCPLRMCYFDVAHDDKCESYMHYTGNIEPAVQWLLQRLTKTELAVEQRVRHDTNMLQWQHQSNLLSNGIWHIRPQRFGRRHRKLWPQPTVSKHCNKLRPQSAPSSVFNISGASPSDTSAK